MKITFAFILTLLFVACQSNSNQEEDISTRNLAAQCTPIIRGVWVKADYIDAVELLKSPLDASGKATDITEMHIEPSNVKNDSLSVGVYYNDHEGGVFFVLFQKGQSKTALRTNLDEFQQKGSFDELNYAVSAYDTVLYLNKFDAHKRLLTSTLFRRVYRQVPQSFDNVLSGTAYVTNKVLFAGTYAGVDSANRPVMMHFANNGTITGNTKARRYQVTTDFVVILRNDIDNMMVLYDNNKSEELTFSFRNDSLNIFSTVMHEDSASRPELQKGRIVYKLAPIRP